MRWRGGRCSVDVLLVLLELLCLGLVVLLLQDPHDLLIPAIGGDLVRALVVLVRERAGSPGLEEQADRPDVAFPRGDVQRRLAVVVPEVEVRHLQHQDAENVDTLRESLRVARGGAGDVRRGLPLRVCAVGARAELKQAPDHRLVAEPGRDVERREAVVVAGVEVGIQGHQRRQDVRQILPDSDVHGRSPELIFNCRVGSFRNDTLHGSKVSGLDSCHKTFVVLEVTKLAIPGRVKVTLVVIITGSIIGIDPWSSTV
mmetsp:Transcript_32706/g.77569  ORF Transcript_32706/g.77569 Transcript_32706/m.77569 type:complete len:257 (+) Transcript_32706:171-941(+)